MLELLELIQMKRKVAYRLLPRSLKRPVFLSAKLKGHTVMENP